MDGTADIMTVTHGQRLALAEFDAQPVSVVEAEFNRFYGTANNHQVLALFVKSLHLLQQAVGARCVILSLLSMVLTT